MSNDGAAAAAAALPVPGARQSAGDIRALPAASCTCSGRAPGRRDGRAWRRRGAVLAPPEPLSPSWPPPPPHSPAGPAAATARAQRRSLAEPAARERVPFPAPETRRTAAADRRRSAPPRPGAQRWEPGRESRLRLRRESRAGSRERPSPGREGGARGSEAGLEAGSEAGPEAGPEGSEGARALRRPLAPGGARRRLPLCGVLGLLRAVSLGTTLAGAPRG